MRIYFLGICGTAMGNAALLLRKAGHVVSGCDKGIYPPMSDVLASEGITVLPGFDPVRLSGLAPDLVVVGNAVCRGNPEFEWLLSEKLIPFTSLPALLHDHLLAKRRNIVIAGTHGKTTTTALTAILLRANGRDPGYFIGGVPLDLPGGAHAGGEGEPFVIEGDEYDSALFDKRAKFIHYAPHIAVINNIEFDHADIFRDVQDVRRVFNHLLRIVPNNGHILLNADDPVAMAVGDVDWAPVLTVGTEESADLHIHGFSEGPKGSSFDLVWRGRHWGRVEWGVWGLCNARNAAMAALAAGLAAMPEKVTGLDLSALVSFKGVKRRQEVLIDSPAVTVIEDFGHHPTAVKNILTSLRNRYPDSRLSAVFEPRSNTSRRRVLQQELMDALVLANAAFLGPIDRPEQVPESERLDPAAVTAFLQDRGTKAFYSPSHDILLDALLRDRQSSPGRHQVVVFFTNGSFGGLMDRYAKACREP